MSVFVVDAFRSLSGVDMSAALRALFTVLYIAWVVRGTLLIYSPVLPTIKLSILTRSGSSEALLSSTVIVTALEINLNG